MKANKIYIKSFYIEIMPAKDGLTKDGLNMRVIGNTKNGEGKKYEIIIHFEIGWISYFIRRFKIILDDKIHFIKDIRNLMN